MAGGIEQGPNGESVVALPAPLYALSPEAAGCPSREPPSSDDPVLGSSLGEHRSSGEGFASLDHQADGGGRRGSCGGGEADGRWRRHPLVVESGPTTFAGSVNASVSQSGGESER